MPRIHNSKLLKADAREIIPHSEAQIYATHFEQDLIVWDIILPADTSIQLDFTGHDQNILFPIAGGIALTENYAAEKIISPGELYSIERDADNIITVTNPFPGMPVNFFYIGYNSHVSHDVATSISTIDLSEKNCLNNVFGYLDNIRIGVYDRHIKDIASLKQKGSDFFIYIINGSFEIEGQLMEGRDGVALWNVNEIELQALSEAAIILIIEW